MVVAFDLRKSCRVGVERNRPVVTRRTCQQIITEAELTNKLKILTNELATAQKETADLNKFMRLVKRYTEITELSPEIVRTFIDKIYVHKGEKAQGGHRQTIEIIYNCVGAVPEMENNRTETNSLDNKSGL